MPRILLAGLFHETHTFLEGETTLADFHVLRGAEMLTCRGDSSPLGGVLELADELGWQLLPAVDYRAQPSATVSAEVLEAFWQELAAVAAPGGYDAVYLILHGAMVCQGVLDVEGEVLQRLRRLTQVPVFGVFDLHANVSPAMASLADGLVGYRENPHTDARASAQRAAWLLQRCLTTGVRPRMQWVHTGLVWPPTGTATAVEPMRSLENRARELEQAHADWLWALNVVAGFSFADTPDTGVSFLACGTADATPPLAELVQLAHQRRHEAEVVDPPAAEVLRQLTATPYLDGLTVLVEPADNIGGGAPGDGTGLLRAMLAYKLKKAALCVVDAQAVRDLEAGTRCIRLGGKGSRLDPGPIELQVELLALQDGRFELEDKHSHLASMCGDVFDMGRCAVVRHAGLTLLITSVKTPPFDLGQWHSQGIAIEHFSFVGVKAAVAHRRAYDKIAARMLWVDTPGPCSSHLKTLPYVHARACQGCESGV